MKTSPEPDPDGGSHAIPAPLSASFSHLDIGSPQLAGSAKLVAAGWDLIAGGIDIWEKSDQFHFLCKKISGDFDIAVRVESFTPAHLYSKAGLMNRKTWSARWMIRRLLYWAAYYGNTPHSKKSRAR